MEYFLKELNIIRKKYQAIAEREEEETSSDSIIPTGRGVVLVMDEDEEDLATVCEMISYLGYKALAAQNLEDARGNREEKDCVAIIIAGLDDGHKSLIAADCFRKEWPDARIFLALRDPNDSLVEKCQHRQQYEIILKPYKLLDLNRAFQLSD